MRVVHSILSADGQCRVDVIEREDGTFGFAELKRYDRPDGSLVWAPLAPYSTITDTAEAAEREARNTVAWLIANSN